MKNRIFNISFSGMALFVLLAVAASCGKKQALPKGEQLVNVYCSGDEFFSDKKNFRANAIGESMDQMTAKKKATANAREELAGSIQVTMKAVIDNYVNSREANNVEDIEERFEGLSRQVINQVLSGTRTICEKQTRTENNTYKTYLAIELRGDDLVKAINERLTEDEKLRIDYDYEKFKKTFEEEMEKMENRY